jgi:hypothetical protein
MKSAKSIITNRLIAKIVDKLQTRCVNSGNVVDGGDGGDDGAPPPKKIKTSASAAAPVPSVVTTDGCQWIGPIGGLNKHASEFGFVKLDCPHASCVVSVYRHQIAAHTAVCVERREECAECHRPLPAKYLGTHKAKKCPKRLVKCLNDGCDDSIPAAELWMHCTDICPFETLKCDFGGGKCNGSYKRGDGSSDHDREASQAHLNIAMGLINAQTRIIKDSEAMHRASGREQTRAIGVQARELEKMMTRIEEMNASQVATARQRSNMIEVIGQHSRMIGMQKSKIEAMETTIKRLETRQAARDVLPALPSRDIVTSMSLYGSVGPHSPLTSLKSITPVNFKNNQLKLSVSQDRQANIRLWLGIDGGTATRYK